MSAAHNSSSHITVPNTTGKGRVPCLTTFSAAACLGPWRGLPNEIEPNVCSEKDSCTTNRPTTAAQACRQCCGLLHVRTCRQVASQGPSPHPAGAASDIWSGCMTVLTADVATLSVPCDTAQQQHDAVRWQPGMLQPPQGVHLQHHTREAQLHKQRSVHTPAVSRKEDPARWTSQWCKCCGQLRGVQCN